MAAIETLPSQKAVPLTTDSILIPLGTGPIAEIMESVPTQTVDVDIRNSAIQEALPSMEIELGVIAPSRKSIERVLGRLVGGVGFLYELYARRDLEGYYDLKIASGIGPLQPTFVAKALQAIDHRVTFFLEGNLVAAL